MPPWIQTNTFMEPNMTCVLAEGVKDQENTNTTEVFIHALNLLIHIIIGSQQKTTYWY